MLCDPAEHAVDDLAVERVLVLAVLFHVLLDSADLVVDVVADGEHLLERALVGEEAAESGYADQHGVERRRLGPRRKGKLRRERHGGHEAGEDGGTEFFPALHV